MKFLSFLKRIFFKFLKKLPLVILVAVIFVLGTLKIVEFFPNTIHQGMQSYFTQLTGATTSITTLNKGQFFPSIYFDMDEISFSQTGNIALIKAEIENLAIKLPLSSMFFGTRQFHNLQVRDLNAKAGFLTPRALKINMLRIMPHPTNSKEAALVMNGQYDSANFDFTIRLNRKKSLFGHSLFSMPNSTDIFINIADVDIKMEMINEGADIWLRHGEAVLNGQTIPLIDSAIVKNRAVNKENIMQCLLTQSYQELNSSSGLCMDYIKINTNN